MPKNKPRGEKKPIEGWISALLVRTIRFVTYDVWRITENEVSGPRGIYTDIIRTVILTVWGLQSENLRIKASALTYSTLLSIVPLLTALLGIAKDLGFQGAVRQELFDYFPGHEMKPDKAFEFVESYLAQMQEGVIIGADLILLFYTVVNLISSVEDTFNDIWQIQKSRPWYRRISDYPTLFLVLLVLMTTSGGLSVFMSTLQNSFLGQYLSFTPLVELFLYITPCIITVLAFTGSYVSLPNTKIRLANGLVTGFIAGYAFQSFQFIRINGQIWVSKYNAAYGGFATLPLLLLWLQLSWLICSFGAELSHASQNVKKFSFERGSKSVNRRYKDFLTLLIASLIVKRFVKGEKPYMADRLSDTYHIPIRIVTQILYLFMELNIIIEMNYGNDNRAAYYRPVINVNKVTVSYLLTRMDKYSSENSKINTSKFFSKEWEVPLKTHEDMVKADDNILLKDL